MFKKLFGKKKSQPSEEISSNRSQAVPESELAMDADIAASLAKGLGEGASKIGLSADNERVIFVAQFQFSPNEISALKRAIEHGNLELRHGLHKMPTYPVIAIQPVIFDNPTDPFWLETFPNIGGKDRAVLQRIRQIGQMGLCFHFYDQRGGLIFRAGYAGSWVGNLGQDIVAAELYLESIPPSTRNYAAAVQQYIRENP